MTLQVIELISCIKASAASSLPARPPRRAALACFSILGLLAGALEAPAAFAAGPEMALVINVYNGCASRHTSMIRCATTSC